MTSLHSPLDLCDRLGLRPSPTQTQLLTDFYENVDPLHAREVPAERTTNTIAVCALWRLLREDGSKVIVISSNRHLESLFMDFLRKLTTEIDPALTSVCNWPHPRVLQIGNAAGHELRLYSNKPNFFKKVPDSVVTWVILGARSSEIHFCDTMKVIDSYRGQEGHRHIYLW